MFLPSPNMSMQKPPAPSTLHGVQKTAGKQATEPLFACTSENKKVRRRISRMPCIKNVFLGVNHSQGVFFLFAPKRFRSDFFYGPMASQFNIPQPTTDGPTAPECIEEIDSVLLNALNKQLQ